jgi:membrane protease YdiL (CAAX protease family)
MRLGIYLAVSFGITWVCWWTLAGLVPPGAAPTTSATFMSLYLLGGFGPTIAAAVAVASTSRSGYKNDYLARLLRWRVKVTWWMAAISAPVVFAVAKEWIAVWTSHGALTAAALEPATKAFILFPTMIIGGGLEELGWRGIAQPEIERWCPRLTATLIVGAVWALWHLPLFYIHGVSQFDGDLPLFAVDVLANAFLLAWIYTQTQSILLCIIAHAASNTATAMGFYVSAAHVSMPIWIATLTKVLAAAILLATTSSPRDRRPIRTSPP